MSNTYPNHEFADVFPMMDRKALDDLTESIRANGLMDPIILFEEKILDGRNRALACEKAGVKPRYETYPGDDPLTYVVAHNLTRRHMTASQRGVVAANIANLKPGRPGELNRPGGLIKPVTEDAAAEQLDVSPRTVRRGRKLLRDGIDTLKDMVETGEVDLTTAEYLISLSEKEQEQAVAGGVAGVKRKAKEVREAKEAARAQTPAPKRPHRIKIGVGDQCWVLARAQLDRIQKEDTFFKPVLKKCIAYCEGRLKANK